MVGMVDSISHPLTFPTEFAIDDSYRVLPLGKRTVEVT